MEKEIKSLTFKEAANETRKSRYGFSSHLFFFALFTILSLMLAYILPLTLIVTVPFVIIPSYFAFTSLNAMKGKPNGENIGFFRMFSSYYSILFFGGYRVLFGFLKAFIAYVASNFLIILVYDLTVFTKSAEFQELMKVVQESTDTAALNQAFEKFTNTVLNNPEIQKWIYLSVAISLVIAAVVFIHHIFIHSLKTRRNLFTKAVAPLRQFNIVDRRVRKEHRKFIWGSYIKTCWFVQIIIVLAGAGGIVGSFFLLKEFNPEQAFVISLFLMFVLTLPLMNYISKVQEIMFFILLPVYEATFATITLELISKYRDKIGIEAEDLKKIEDLLDKQKQEFSDKKDEEDNNLEDK